jgi:squalene monooxygenase
MVGDVLNMRHPLTGGGMTVALKDVELLSECLGRLALTGARAAPERRVASAIASFYARRGRHASTINILANALHRVFTKPVGDDGTRARLREACIEYLGMGGAFAAGPVGLLSGLTPKPWVLVAHFFAVAAYATRTALLPPTPARLRQGWDLMHVACAIIMPLLAAERTTFLAWRPVQWATDVMFHWRTANLD